VFTVNQKAYTFLALSFFPWLTYANSSSSLATVFGSNPNALLKAKLLSPLEAQQRIDFSVWFNLRNEEQLHQFINNELYNPSSYKYQQFLTTEEFNKLYGLHPKTVQTIKNYFATQGFKVIDNKNHLTLSGTVEQIKKTFHVQLNNYRYNNENVFGSIDKIKLDPNIARHISSVMGLNNIKDVRPLYLRAMGPNSQNTVNGPKSPRASLTGANMQKVYNALGAAPINGTPINGAGQTIVIVGACSPDSPETILSDANAFNVGNGLPMFTSSNFSVISNTGGPAPYGGPSCNITWSAETSMDIQAAHSIAPQANIVVIVSPNAGIVGLSKADNYAIQHYPGALVSHSWSGGEGSGPDKGPYSILLPQAAAQGLSMLFSSGDYGDYKLSNNSTIPHVMYPSSSPYAVSVGGTAVFSNTNWSYLFETGWGWFKTNTAPTNFVAGSGGGISRYYTAIPSQAAAISNFVAGGYSGTVGSHQCGSGPCRAVPDIAMDGDPYTGLIVYNSASCSGFCGSESGGGIGGTSLSAPLYAGVLALVNQARSLVAGGQPKPIGLITPYLYSHLHTLRRTGALSLVNPPHMMVPGTSIVAGYPDAFIQGTHIYNIDSSLTIPENQSWNDVVGVGSPSIPNFVQEFSTL
jgi:subtilase family serine protease